MESSDMKNMVVLKNLPSNMVEEAIIIFKENQRIKEEILDSNNKVGGVEVHPKSKEYILKEAENLISDYISKIENKKKGYKDEINIKIKYKRLKYYSIVMSIFFIISFIINVI